MKKIIDIIFAKNYPLWFILILVAIIGYLAFKPLTIAVKALKEKRIVVINGEAVTCLPFNVQPIVEEVDINGKPIIEDIVVEDITEEDNKNE